MRNKSKLVFGLGINDVDYNVYEYSVVNGEYIVTWVCPYYTDWKDLLRRCFDNKYQSRFPTYINCTVCSEWLSLSSFINWVNLQPNKDWQNCQLDKDLLSTECKIYSADTAVYISKLLNTFILTCNKSRGDYMLGVYVSGSNIKPYRSVCSDPFSNRRVNLGNFTTELEAHKAWQAKKHEYACMLAEQQQDPRVAKALRERYAPDKDWTNR